MTCELCGATKLSNCDCTPHERAMLEELNDLQKFSDDTYKFVRNLHSRAMRMYLDSGRIPSLELKGQEAALWKVLKFMGAPLNDRAAMEEVSDE